MSRPLLCATIAIALQSQAMAQLAPVQPDVALLVGTLRQDRFVQNVYGNHSVTMRALEKMGTPAVAALDGTLTPAVMRGETPADVDYLKSVTLVLSVIDGRASVPALVRLATSAGSFEVRELAYDALVWPAFDLEPELFARGWDACLGRESAIACPFDPFYLDTPRQQVLVRPLLGEIRRHFERETHPRVRLSAARLLAAWGDEAMRRAGEGELMVQAARSGDARAQERAMRALGLLGVDAARDVIRTAAAAATGSLQTAGVEALAMLRDPGIVPIVTTMMQAPQERYGAYAARWATQFAGRSRNLAFVPPLIDLLGDTRLNGVTSYPQVDGRSAETRDTIGEDALASLRRLTFQDLDGEPQAWRAWWAANERTDWRTHLQRVVADITPQMSSAPAHIMNELMARVADVDDPAVLPVLTAYFRNPRADPNSTGPRSSVGGFDTPRGLISLASLARQGISEAREALSACGDVTRFPLSIQCPRMLAVFDRPRALAQLKAAMTGGAGAGLAAEALARLGDASGIPVLVDELDASDRRSPELAWASHRRLQYYTQQEIPYDRTASPDVRRAAVGQWQAWRRATSATFVVPVRAVAIDADCCRSDKIIPVDSAYVTGQRIPRLASGSGIGAP